MKFDIICTMPVDDEGHMRPRKFVYDNLTSELTDEEGKHVYEKPEFSKYVNASNLKAVSRETPVGKKDIKILKIQLGLSCNYSCEYCSQRFVPTAEETSSKHVDKFLENLDSWMKETPKKVEFWGGEPLVYFKTLKPLAEALRIKWPDVKFLMITNGSLLTPEINDWLVEQNVDVGISHDGPGQVDPRQHCGAIADPLAARRCWPPVRPGYRRGRVLCPRPCGCRSPPRSSPRGSGGTMGGTWRARCTSRGSARFCGLMIVG